MRISPNDAVLLAASVGLSILLWVFVGAEERSEIVLSAPLEYRNLPKGFEISSEGQILNSVNVWVQGSTATIKNLRPQEIACWVDLSNVKPGSKNFELTQDNVSLPYGFSVLRISPSRIHLRVEEVTNRMVAVVARFEGEPAEGYTVSETTITPSTVEITGPQSAVNSVRNVTTDSIDITGLKVNHTERVNVGVENATVRLGNIRDVTVSLKITEIRDLLTLRRVPVSVTGAKREVRFNPKVVRIDLLAPKRLLSQISEDNVKVVLELNGLKPGDYEVTPRVIFDPEQEKVISVKEVTPERVHVRIL